MRDLQLWNRSSLSRSIFDEMDKALNDVFGRDFFPAALSKSTYPKMNVYDENGDLKIDAYVPEIQKDKLSVEIKDNILTLTGNSDSDKKNEGNTYYFRELSRKSFSRSIQLPENVDLGLVSADHSDGMLRIKIPYKKEQEVTNTRKVKIA